MDKDYSKDCDIDALKESIYSERWTLADCEQVLHNPTMGERALRMWGVPVAPHEGTYSGMRRLQDCVPYSQKKLDALTRKYCSASPEFAPRAKSDACYASQNLKQRFPTGGPTRTRQSTPLPWESGRSTLPGMEKYAVDMGIVLDAAV